MGGKKIFIIGAVILALAVLCIFAFDSRLKIQRYSLSSDKLQGDVRIALITDLHACKYGENESELISAVEAEAPDLVLFGGDIFDDEMPYDNAEALISGIAGRYPCYYVSGNHEYWGNDIDNILGILESYGVTVLNGNGETVEINGRYINICGITDPDIVRYADSDFSAEKQLEGLRDIGENGYYTVLLSHRPELVELYEQYAFDLILCGHAHGGQWRIPGILNGLFAPNQGIFPKYAGGLYELGESTMIVSRGLARETTGAPRIFNRPELVIIDL